MIDIEKQLARRAVLSIKYKGVDITKDMTNHLESFSATDNVAYTADDISISIEDSELKWLNSWWPEKGDTLQAKIITTDWLYQGHKAELDLGTFLIDEPEYSTSPNVMNLQGISTPRNTNFTDTPKDKGWEKITLKNIASEIAGKNGMKLTFDSKINPFFKRLDQSKTSDMNFLCDLCRKFGAAFKIINNTIVVFDYSTYEAKKPVRVINRLGGKVHPGVKLKTGQGYTACKITSSDENGKKTTYTFKDPTKKGLPDKILDKEEQVDSQAEAELLAKGYLREVNSAEWVVSMTHFGDTMLVAGATVELKNFGVFDGTYIIDKASYSLNPFTVSIEIHRVLGW